MGNNHLWKTLYTVPIPFLVTSLFICICCFRHETVGFLVANGKKDAAKKALKQIYMGEEDEDYDERYKKLLDQVSGEKPKDENDDNSKEGGSYEPPNSLLFEGGEQDDKNGDGDTEAKKDEKDEAADAAAEAKNWRKKLPAFLQSKPGEVSAFDALTAPEHRNGTWLCFVLAFFNVMSGIQILLVYFTHVFENIDEHAPPNKQQISLTGKQMSSALISAVVFGGIASVKVLENASRRTAFCVGHFMIGVCLYGAGSYAQ